MRFARGDGRGPRPAARWQAAGRDPPRLPAAGARRHPREERAARPGDRGGRGGGARHRGGLRGRFPAASSWGRRARPPTPRFWIGWRRRRSPSWWIRWTGRRTSRRVCRSSAAWRRPSWPGRSSRPGSTTRWGRHGHGDPRRWRLAGRTSGERLTTLRVAPAVPVGRMVGSISWNYFRNPCAAGCPPASKAGGGGGLPLRGR
jgi:hypothetical protein